MQKINPVSRIRGCLAVPGDKSISHRALMLAAIAEGTSVITGLSSGQDVQSTVQCLRALGVEITHDADATRVRGAGQRGLTAPTGPLNAGNSGTTIRLLSGILAGQPFISCLDGDASLRRRPMQRIITPLQQMGARIEAETQGRPPLTIAGGALQGITYALPVASAQVKSAILLAGLYAAGPTIVIEPGVTRDHTERMLRCMGGEVAVKNREIRLTPGNLQGRDLHVPGDFSSAMFLLAAALLVPDSELRLPDVGLNATRCHALQVLQRAGAHIEIERLRAQNQEEFADLAFQSSRLGAFHLTENEIPLLIDEIPVLAVMATQAEGTTRIRGASELRVKESDRIESISQNLHKMGAIVRTFPDGLEIDGPVRLHGAEVDAFGDHRIAMAMAVAGLIATGETTIRGASVARISYPEFFVQLSRISA